jgi:hypothetical protein
MNLEIIDALIKYEESRYHTFWRFTMVDSQSRQKLLIKALQELRDYETTAHPGPQCSPGVTQ